MVKGVSKDRNICNNRSISKFTVNRKVSLHMLSQQYDDERAGERKEWERRSEKEWAEKNNRIRTREKDSERKNDTERMREKDCLFVVVLCHSNSIQLYHGGDMMYEMRCRKPEPTPLPAQRFFNLPHHIGMVWAELAFDDAVSYTQWGNGLQQS